VIDLGVTRQHLYSARHVHAEWTAVGGAPMNPSKGSGFFVEHEEAIYLVTNRHVVDLGYADSKYLGTSISGLSVRGFDTCAHQDEHEATYCIGAPIITVGPNDDDVAVVPVSTATVCEGHSCPLSNFYRSDLLASDDEFESDDRSKSILATDALAVCGFPELDGKIQQRRPLAMVGFISSDPSHRPDPLPSLVGGGEIRSSSVVLYQGFSRSGASGSPILAVQRGLQLGGALTGPPSRPTRLIGINVGRITGSSSNPAALSYFVRSDSILDTITRAHAQV